jgi:hypothetical protein
MLRVAVSSPPGDGSGARVGQTNGCWSQKTVVLLCAINGSDSEQTCWRERAEQSTMYDVVKGITVLFATQPQSWSFCLTGTMAVATPSGKDDC